MHGFLGEEYFQHYLLLVEATFLLLQDSISPEELTKSERLFQHFCLMLGRLYHPRYELINVHSLTPSGGSKRSWSFVLLLFIWI